MDDIDTAKIRATVHPDIPVTGLLHDVCDALDAARAERDDLRLMLKAATAARIRAEAQRLPAGGPDDDIDTDALRAECRRGIAADPFWLADRLPRVLDALDAARAAVDEREADLDTQLAEIEAARAAIERVRALCEGAAEVAAADLLAALDGEA